MKRKTGEATEQNSMHEAKKAKTESKAKLQLATNKTLPKLKPRTSPIVPEHLSAVGQSSFSVSHVHGGFVPAPVPLSDELHVGPYPTIDTSSEQNLYGGESSWVNNTADPSQYSSGEQQHYFANPGGNSKYGN